MKTKQVIQQSSARGLTLIEALVTVVLVILVVVVICLGMLNYGGLAKDKARGQRAACQNNLKQVGIAFVTWAADHNHEFPMLVSTNAGGTRERLAGSNFFQHFQMMSNEINNPKILTCPSDDRYPASDLANLANSNLSYFVGLDADETRPAMWLAGDRNLVTNGMNMKPGLAVLGTNTVVGWSQKMHNQAGNIVLADGSVQQTSELSLRSLFQSTGTNVTRLAVP